ncbi:MAG: hypothetical protein WCC38_10780 [Pseudonocardiaceae bacterium]
MTTARGHHGQMATGLDRFGAAGEFAVEDLERMPDDGYRYELTPSLQALDLVAGRYVEVRCPSGEQAWQAKRPFPVTIAPATLGAGLRQS